MENARHDRAFLSRPWPCLFRIVVSELHDLGGQAFGVAVALADFDFGADLAVQGIDAGQCGIIDFEGIGDGTGKRLKVKATAEDGSVKEFEVRVLLETPKEVEYFKNGGLLQYVLRQLAANKAA